jgi:malate dehydrogenase (oxaloacetate-decarboxylating)
MVNPASSYTFTLRIEGESRVGLVYEILGAVSAAGGLMGEIDIIGQETGCWVRDFTVHCEDIAQQKRVVEAVRQVAGAKVVLVVDETFRMHMGGKISIQPKFKLRNKLQLSQAYTPGVGRVSTYIAQDPVHAWDFTIRKNTIAIVSDGSKVLGLGALGPLAALPVMEGKALLFKELGGVDAFPLCINASTTEEIIEFCERIAPTFGGINLEDITAPRCFQIEDALREKLDIPVFHDDQHGTAIVALAALRNALKVVGKQLGNVTVAINGVGAAGTAVAKMLLEAGVGDVIPVDRFGVLEPGQEGMNAEKLELLRATNKSGRTGSLHDALRGSDVFIGLSVAHVLPPEWIKDMAKDPIVFAMANPVPEILPELAAPYAAIVASGRSDYPNQINNVLAFPGIFRGALDSHARDINGAMKHAASEAIAACIPEDQLSAENIIPSVFDKQVAVAVARATAQAAHDSGVAQLRPELTDVLPDV